MKDIVMRLDTVVGSQIAADAKQEIESLRQQLSDLKAEMKMDSEGPDWIQRAMQAEASEDVLKEQIAECQAQIKSAKREAFFEAAAYIAKQSLPDVYSERCLDEFARDIRNMET